MQLNQTIDKFKEYDFLRTVMTNLPGVAFVIRPDGTVLFAEGKGIALAGLKRDDVLGTNVSKYFSLYPGFEERVRRVLAGETLASTVVAPNQSCLEVTYSPLRDDEGSICGVIGVAQDVTERRKTELELRDSEEKFRSITSAATDAIIMMDQTGRISLWNEAAQVIFGYTEQEAIGQDLHFLVAPKRYHNQTMLESFTSRGESPLLGKVVELSAKRKSGEEFPLELSLSAFRLHGQWHAVGTARDITERKRAEQQLRESEEKFSRAFQANAALMAITDIGTSRFVDVNEAFIKVLGFARDEVIGRTAGELELFVDMGRRQAAAKEVETGKSVRNFEATVRTKSGDLRHGIFSAEKIVLQGADCMLTVMVDITERKQAEESLRESREVLHAVLNSIPVRVFWKDRDSRYLGCNLAFARDAGYERPEDIIGKDDRAMGWREQAELYRADDRGAIESGNAKLHIEEPQTTLSGEQIHLLTSKVPLRDVDGAIVGVLGVYQDITERKRAEAVLQESERRLSSIYETVGDVIFHLRVEVDGNYRFISVNQAFCNVTGLGKDMIVGRLIDEVIPEPSLHIALGKYQQAIKENSIIRWEETSDYPNGRVTGEASIAPVFDNEGHCTHLVGSIHDVTERKRAVQALRESENAYRAIFENTGSATVIIEEDTTISLVNSEFERLSGWTRDEVEGKRSWTQFVVPEDLDMMVARHHLRRENPSVAPATYEFRLRDKNGVIKHVLLNVVMIAGTGKSVASLTEITERKRMEEALRVSENAYRAIFENTGTATVISEEDTTISLVNSEFEKLTGYSKTEAEGKMRWIEFMAQGDVDRMLGKHRLRRTDSSAALKGYEFKLLCKNGAVRDVLMTVDVIPGTGQSVASCLDITERKQAEEALKESEEKSQRIFEDGPLGMMMAGRDFRFMRVNAAACKMLGYSPLELTSLTFKDITHPDHLSEDSAFVRQVFSGEILCYRTEKRYIRKDGETVWGALTLSAIRSDDGRFLHFLAMIEDIMERKQAQEEKERLQQQLQQSQKLEAIGTMAGGIAHDFNNILTGILGFTELVRSDIPKSSQAYDNLNEVVKAGRRARDLVKQILSFSRKAETEKSLISLGTVVKDALKLIRSVTPSRISIKQSLTASPERAILADPTQMHQVMLNLCINAADAMADGGILEISLEEVQVETASQPEQTQIPSGCYLKLTVRDNGAGMSPEVRERIFEPYFTTKQVGKGTGMGLAVVHGVVKEHGGSITVSSELGRGTVFEIYLPAVEATPDSEISSLPIVALGSESILFVDDESMITNLQRTQLGRWGYRVTATENSATALSIFRASPQDFDLVITDQSIPCLTGVKLAEAIHQINPSTPIILCTGFDENISRENAGKIGIRAILTKPITGAEFGHAIRKVLDEAPKPSPSGS